MAKIELVLESSKIKSSKSEMVKWFEDELQANISRFQTNDCLRDDSLAASLHFEKNGVQCGYGCQMHSVASGFIYATDLHRMFFIDNFKTGGYYKYFGFFNKKCEGTVETRNDSCKFFYLN